MSAGEVSPDDPALPWCVIWCALNGDPNDGVIVARFLERSDAVTWIAVTTHAMDVATRCGVLGDMRVLLAHDGDLEVDDDQS
jgi:hypothetical protein